MKKLFKKRNPHAMNPLMRKGGVHQKSNKAQRAAAKRETRALSRDSYQLFIKVSEFFRVKTVSLSYA